MLEASLPLPFAATTSSVSILFSSTAMTRGLAHVLLRVSGQGTRSDECAEIWLLAAWPVVALALRPLVAGGGDAEITSGLPKGLKVPRCGTQLLNAHSSELVFPSRAGPRAAPAPWVACALGRQRHAWSCREGAPATSSRRRRAYKACGPARARRWGQCARTAGRTTRTGNRTADGKVVCLRQPRRKGRVPLAGLTWDTTTARGGKRAQPPIVLAPALRGPHAPAPKGHPAAHYTATKEQTPAHLLKHTTPQRSHTPRPRSSAAIVSLTPVAAVRAHHQVPGTLGGVADRLASGAHVAHTSRPRQLLVLLPQTRSGACVVCALSRVRCGGRAAWPNHPHAAANGSCGGTSTSGGGNLLLSVQGAGHRWGGAEARAAATQESKGRDKSVGASRALQTPSGVGGDGPPHVTASTDRHSCTHRGREAKGARVEGHNGGRRAHGRWDHLKRRYALSHPGAHALVGGGRR